MIKPGTILAIVLILVAIVAITIPLGRHERGRLERACLAKGGELHYLRRNTLCAKPGTILEVIR